MKLLILFIVFSQVIFSQDIVGKWIAIDTDSNKESSVIEVYKVKNQYFAKIIDILWVKKSIASCAHCSKKIKDKSLLNKIVIKNLEKDKDIYKNGTLINPFNDKSYSCEIKFLDSNKIQVKAYSMFSIFSKNQIWIKKQ